MPRTHTVHLVQNEDRTKKACNGEVYIPPNGQPGDTLVLCQACNNSYLDYVRKPKNA